MIAITISQTRIFRSARNFLGDPPDVAERSILNDRRSVSVVAIVNVLNKLAERAKYRSWFDKLTTSGRAICDINTYPFILSIVEGWTVIFKQPAG